MPDDVTDPLIDGDQVGAYKSVLIGLLDAIIIASAIAFVLGVMQYV